MIPRRLEFTQQIVEGLGDVVLLNGSVVSGDARRFSAFIAGLDEPPAVFALNSPGGIVEEALAIGRSIRKMEADTTMLPGTYCVSSCPYILAAGVERTVSLRSAVGLHQHYYQAPGYMPVYFAVEDIQANQSRTMEYLIEMGLDPGVMVHSLATPPDEIYVLVEDELTSSRMATEIVE
ncbi:hypothetical protein R3X27_18850 [Tropicimonas sp. TH_r6]|uniref:COG3904 family protein n=1 Tax=Tropicimonas sp. TH_r6 TaxID=3082085 RepID=UPI0029539BAF|nr:hypothetical protein [Tropicimonas sp. TH_r6]MDV7144745.1 hypothetical protein [Tropicimonas sp. TH_r6]